MPEKLVIYDLRDFPDRPKDFIENRNKDDMKILLAYLEKLAKAGEKIFLIRARESEARQRATVQP